MWGLLPICWAWGLSTHKWKTSEWRERFQISKDSAGSNMHMTWADINVKWFQKRECWEVQRPSKLGMWGKKVGSWNNKNTRGEDKFSWQLYSCKIQIYQGQERCQNEMIVMKGSLHLAKQEGLDKIKPKVLSYL